MKPSRPAPAPLRRALAALLLPLALLTGACRSTEPDAEVVEFPSVDGKFTQTGVQAEDTVGFLMARLGQEVQVWSNLKQRNRDEEDERRLRGVEGWLREKTQWRLAEILTELESGPPQNRAVAAVAVGFSGAEAAQSPLLAALDDRDAQVVSNALMGLGILGMADTPLDRVCDLVRIHPDPAVRRNAAFALQRLVEAGSREACARESAHEALRDTEAPVRVMSAIVLAQLDEGDALRALGDRLHDEDEIVAVAAATAIAAIGQRVSSRTGEAARLLVEGMAKHGGDRRWRIEYELMRLADRDHGDLQQWREWANRLP